MSERPRLFHLADGRAWRSARARGDRDWRPASLAAEGFVHLSFAHQVAGTLAVHFADASDLVLLEVALVDPEALVVEPSRGGEPFPHLYRPLLLAECRREVALVRGADGAFDLGGAHLGD